MMSDALLNRPALAVLNHLLAQSGWGAKRLARFKGKCARIHVAPFTLAFIVGDDGLLGEAAANASTDASLTLAPSLLPRLALNDEKAFDEIAVAGDAALIEEILFLARHIKWDAAEDLSRVTGDIAAERIVGFTRHGMEHARHAAQSLAEAAAEYFMEERPLVAAPAALAGFKTAVAELHERAATLEARINRLIRP